MERRAFVHEAELELGSAVDPAAVGAAVTVALCGHWEHEGPCRWPHNNAIAETGDTVTFRTLFVALPADEKNVRDLIDGALRRDQHAVLRAGAREVTPNERELAQKLGGV
jgi:hypothetical protein